MLQPLSLLTPHSSLLTPFFLPYPSDMNYGLCVVGLCAIALGCAAEEEDLLSRDPIHGTMQSVAWTGGQASVRTDPKRGIVIRIHEASAAPDADVCALSVTQGRRIEIMMPRLEVGKFDASKDAGFRVEAWDGLTGWSDPSSLAEIDQAPKGKGETVTGRARFGSSLNGEVIEGQFTATLCEDLP
jgi:hypothetical protein